jgi:hypothetical protein
MKKSQALAVVAVLIGALLALTGCAKWFEDPAKPANAAIAVANAHLKKAAALSSQIASDAVVLDSLPASTHGAAKGLNATAALKVLLASEKTELIAAKTAMDGIAKLEVAAEFKQYAKLESTAISTRVTMTDTNTRLYDALDRFYTALKSKATVDPQQILTVIDQIKQEMAALTEQAVTESKAASDYFTSKKLGG